MKNYVIGDLQADGTVKINENVLHVEIEIGTHWADAVAYGYAAFKPCKPAHDWLARKQGTHPSTGVPKKGTP